MNITQQQADILDNSSPANKLFRSGSKIKGLYDAQYFTRTVTLTSAAAATAINLVADSEVEVGKKIYVLDFIARINGATNWATVANVFLEDTNASPIIPVTFPVAVLLANTTLFKSSAGITLAAALLLGTGCNDGNGLQIVGNANGTGSDLVITVTGVIK